MKYVLKGNQIAFFLLICLIIAPAYSFAVTTSGDSKINGKIAFQSNRDGNWEIYLMNPDGSDQTRLTNNNYDDQQPNWSPNGTKIAFITDRDGNWEIYVMNADGSRQTRLTNNNVDDWNPSWSPDGTEIAFASERDGNPEIYVMNSDGSGSRRLTYNSYWDDMPTWSPDGSKIAFESDRGRHWEVYSMNADGSGETNLTNNRIYDGEPSWYPGAKILFCSQLAEGYAEIYVMNPDGSGRTRLTNNEFGDENAVWSPDGSKIVFITDRHFQPDTPSDAEWGNWEIYTMNTDGSGETRLTNNDAADYGVSWQPLTLKTATLTLQSSKTTVTVDEMFNLNATLSVPRSGTATLYWSINGSGFLYRQNRTMTNGEYGRSFGAGSLGTWIFKVVWLGDSEYMSAESNNITITVLQTLTATVTATSPTVYSGGSSTIKTTLTSGGAPITGASMTLTSSSGGTFSAVTDQGNGTYMVTYIAPDVIAQTKSTISVTAKKSGYQDASGQTQLTLQPLAIIVTVKDGDGTAISGVAVASTSQPNGQTALSGTTDASGKASFSNVLKGTYTFKASKSGYEDKTWTITVSPGQAAAETVTLVKQSGIPGYPITSIFLALVVAVFILNGAHLRKRVLDADVHVRT